MKIFSLISLLIIFSFKAISQVNNQIYIGAIKVEGSKPYSYQLEFLDSSNILKGFSITDLVGNDQTKTQIRGVFNKDNKTISFTETKLISTRSKINRDSFCYIHATLKLKNKGKNKFLVGNFTGYRNNQKTICGKGTISLMCKSDIVRQIQKLGKVGDTLTKILNQVDSAQSDTTYIDEIPVQKSFNLQPNTKQVLPCRGSEALIEVWDNGKIDGDIITIKRNSIVLSKGLQLSEKKEIFTIRLISNQIEHISILADNEGAEPPATVRMTCTCGKTVYTIDANSSIGKPVELIIIDK